MKISDVPLGPQNRLYRQQFQGPPQLGHNHWRLHLISDTFIGEEVTHEMEVCSPFSLPSLPRQY